MQKSYNCQTAFYTVSFSFLSLRTTFYFSKTAESMSQLAMAVQAGCDILILAAAFLMFRKSKAMSKRCNLQNLRRKRYRERIKNLSDFSHASKALAHDLRAPISMLKSFAREMEKHDNLESFNHLKQTLVHQLAVPMQRAETLLREMVTDNPQDLQLEACRLSTLLENALTHVKGLRPNDMQSITVSKIFDVEDLVLVDRTKVERAFINIIQNALDACDCKQTISLKIKPCLGDRKKLTVSICNSGSFIPIAQQQKIFNEGYSTKGYRGTGYGLSFVKKTIQQHRGTIRCKSSLETGSEFQIDLPKFHGKVFQEAPVVGKPKVAFVEDNIFHQEVWKQKLKGTVDFICFNHPNEFAAYLKGQHAKGLTMVITDDYFVDDQSGETFKGGEYVLRLAQKSLNIPVILSTECPSAARVEEGFSAIISKVPLAWSDLAELFESVRHQIH